MNPIVKTIWRVSWICCLIFLPVIIYQIIPLRNILEPISMNHIHPNSRNIGTLIIFWYAIYTSFIVILILVSLLFWSIWKLIYIYYSKEKSIYIKPLKERKKFWKRIYN